MDAVFSNESRAVPSSNESNDDNEDGFINVVFADNNNNNNNHDDIAIKNNMSIENDGIDTVPVNTTGFVVHQVRQWKDWMSGKTTTTTASDCCNKHSDNNNNGYWKILVAGQILSFLLASTGAASATLHFECNLSAPTAQMGLVYLLLSLRAPFRFKCSLRNDAMTAVSDDNNDGDSNSCLLQRWMSWFFRLKPNSGLSWYKYPLIALLDVEANYFTFLAFRYTTLNSVSIFDALAIPSAMVASRFILRTQYQRCHLMGALICMIGVTLNVLRDYFGGNTGDDTDFTMQQKYPHQILGDMIAILGALLHGLRDVMTEHTLHHLETATPTTCDSDNCKNIPQLTTTASTKNNDDKQKESLQNTNEYLGMIGVFGTLISIFQCLILEQDAINEFFHRTTQVVAAIGSTQINNSTSALMRRFLQDDELYYDRDEYNTSYYFPTDDDGLFTAETAWWVQSHDEKGSSVGFVSKYTSMNLQTCSETSGLLLLLAYVVATYFTYVGTSRFLIVSEAALLNLSLLTGDLWAVFFSVIAEHIMPQTLFWIALFLIMSGVLIYETGPSPVDHLPNNNDNHHIDGNKNGPSEGSNDDDSSVHSYHTHHDSEDESQTQSQGSSNNKKRSRRRKKHSLSNLCKKDRREKNQSTFNEHHLPYVVFAEPDIAGGRPPALPQELPRYYDTYNDDDHSYQSSSKCKQNSRKNSIQKNINRYRSRIRRGGNIVSSRKSSNYNSSALWLNESHELELVVTV